MRSIFRSSPRTLWVFLLALAAPAPPAVADCDSSVSVFFGNFSALTYLQLDVKDPAAYWRTYIYENSDINQGQAPLSAVAFDNSELTGPGTALVFGDWLSGLGMAGCPLSECCRLVTCDPTQVVLCTLHQVFVFGDSRGSTVAIVEGETVFDLDATRSGGGQLVVSPMKPSVVALAANINAIDLALRWNPLVVNTDLASSAIASSLVRAYRIFQRRYSLGGLVSEQEVQDLDGDVTDTQALVSLTTELYSASKLYVQADLQASAGSAPPAAARGVLSNFILTGPALVPSEDPRSKARGKGQGLQKDFPGSRP